MLWQGQLRSMLITSDTFAHPPSSKRKRKIASHFFPSHFFLLTDGENLYLFMICSSIMPFSSLTWGLGSRRSETWCGYQNAWHKTKSPEFMTVLSLHSNLIRKWMWKSLKDSSTRMNQVSNCLCFVHVPHVSVVESSFQTLLCSIRWNKVCMLVILWFWGDTLSSVLPFCRWGKRGERILLLWVAQCQLSNVSYILCASYDE